jgi:hypothetical protein
MRRTHTATQLTPPCMNKLRINPLGNGSVMWQLSVSLFTTPLLYGSQLLTAAAWLHFQGSSCGILGGPSGTGRRFCLGILLIRGSIIPRMLHILLYIIWRTDGRTVHQTRAVNPNFPLHKTESHVEKEMNYLLRWTSCVYTCVPWPRTAW